MRPRRTARPARDVRGLVAARPANASDVNFARRPARCSSGHADRTIYMPNSACQAARTTSPSKMFEIAAKFSSFDPFAKNMLPATFVIFRRVTDHFSKAPLWTDLSFTQVDEKKVRIMLVERF